MSWSIILAFFVGSICAIRFPIFHFTLVVTIGMIAYGLSCVMSDWSVASAAIWSIVYGAALEIGYVFSHLILFFVYRKVSGDKRDPASPVMRSRFSPDQK